MNVSGFMDDINASGSGTFSVGGVLSKIVESSKLPLPCISKLKTLLNDLFPSV